MMLSAFEFDEGGHAGIETVDATDSGAERRPDTIVIRRGRGERAAGYFRVDPRRVASGDYRYVVVEYLDRGTGRWYVEHDRDRPAADGRQPWSSSDRIALENTGTWRRAAIELKGPRFTGSLDNADFRIVVIDHSEREFVMRSLAISEGHPATAANEVPGPEPRSRMSSRHGCVRPPARLPLRLPRPNAVSASIIVPVLNRLEYTLECLRAIMEYTPPIYEVIVIDNGSHDGSGAHLAGIANLRLLRNDANQGFAKACNAGAKIARGEWLVFLNNDTVPQPGWLTAMIAAAERPPHPAVVGSKLIYPQSGTVQHAGVSFSGSRLPRHDYEHVDPADDAVSVDREVAAVTGACLLTSADRFRSLGGFDERFVNGFEDIDYCLRARRDGGRVLFCARSVLLHYKSASASRVSTSVDKANIELFRGRWDDLVGGELASPAAPAARGASSRRRDPVRAWSNLARNVLPRHIAVDSEETQSRTGERNDGKVICRRGEHPPGHCVYGGYLEVGEAMTARAEFLIQVSNSPGRGKPLAALDVYDCAGDHVLSQGTLRDPGQATALSRCAVEFSARPGQILEFRVFWRGSCDLTVAGIDIVPA